MQKEQPDTTYVQEDFFHLLPGYAGGKALLIQRGPEHFRQLAWASAQRPEEERKQAARRGAMTRLRKLYTVPRTEVFEGYGMRLVERVVPWWPHWATKRRRRPIYVRIELEFRHLEDEE